MHFYRRLRRRPFFRDGEKRPQIMDERRSTSRATEMTKKVYPRLRELTNPRGKLASSRNLGTFLRPLSADREGTFFGHPIAVFLRRLYKSSNSESNGVIGRK